MQKVQKIMIVFALVFVLIFAYSINVKAATLSDLEDWNVATRDGNVYTLNESDTEVKQDIEVQDGESVVLDLNGQTLTNFTDGCSTITVEEGGLLTIMGEGTITNTSSNNVPTITNNGDLVIVNGNITSNNTNYAVCVLNNGYVRITGGTITTTTQNCWGLTNSGTAEITGGTFEQKGNFSVILNAAKMEISGGTVAVSSGYSAITNESPDGTSASLTITDVTVTGAKSIISNPEGESVVVTGGNYGTDSNISDYLDESYVIDENGDVVEAPEIEEPTPGEPSEDEDLTDEKPTTDEDITDGETTDEEVTDEETTSEEPTTDEETTDNEVVEDEVSENPQTGDTIIVFATIFAVAIVGLVATIIVKRKMK